MLAPPRGSAPPPAGNPGSAPALPVIRYYITPSGFLYLVILLIIGVCWDISPLRDTRPFLCITDVWREYLRYEGLDVTLQLVIPSGDVSPTAASSLVDNNVTSCMNTDSCPNNGEVSL